MIVTKSAGFQSFQSNENGQEIEVNGSSDERIKKLVISMPFINYKSIPWPIFTETISSELALLREV